MGDFQGSSWQSPGQTGVSWAPTGTPLASASMGLLPLKYPLCSSAFSGTSPTPCNPPEARTAPPWAPQQAPPALPWPAACSLMALQSTSQGLQKVRPVGFPVPPARGRGSANGAEQHPPPRQLSSCYKTCQQHPLSSLKKAPANSSSIFIGLGIYFVPSDL